MATLSDDPRSSTNPIFNDNTLKLGVFGYNGPGVSMTKVPELYIPTWDNSVRVSKLADDAGLEALVPYARWRPFGPPTSPRGRVFETYTWAAGMAASTRHSCIMSTSHTTTLHPLVAAKQATTVDHISHGRSAINIVCGWFVPEIEMFGAEIKPHGERYAHAHEWIEVMKRVWTRDEPVSFEGNYVRVKDAVSSPKPVQAPFPALMNAGGSVDGQHFAAQHCDIAFVLASDQSPEAIKAQVDKYRRLAKEEYGRHLQVWLLSYVVQRETEAEARAYVKRYVEEFGDHEVVDMFIKYQIESAKTMPPNVVEKIRYGLMAGSGGVDLVGTPTMIAERLKMLSNCGIDGVLLSWIDYEQGLKAFVKDVLPLLEQMDLRKATRSAAVAMAGQELA